MYPSSLKQGSHQSQSVALCTILSANLRLGLILKEKGSWQKSDIMDAKADRRLVASEMATSLRK